MSIAAEPDAFASTAAPALPAGVDTPAAVVDLTIVRRNVDRMAAEIAGRGQTLRPHAKTHGSTSVAALQRDAGADGLTVGTLRMAEAFARAGVRNLFIAAPLWPSAATAARIRALHDASTIIVGLDAAESARALGEAVAGGRRPLRVAIELDSGERRSGVRPDQVPVLARAASDAGLRVIGVFTHGGHSYAKPGRGPEAAADERRVLREAGDALVGAGFDVEVSSAGSTPTVWHSGGAPITEQRPGTYVFNDRQQVGLGAATPGDVALVIAGTVTSTAVPGQVILDAGAKALAKDRPPWLPGHGVLLGYPGALITRVFDFHAVVELAPGAARPRLGEVVAVVPNHACAAVNLARELLVFDDGAIRGRWLIDARG